MNVKLLNVLLLLQILFPITITYAVCGDGFIDFNDNGEAQEECDLGAGNMPNPLPAGELEEHFICDSNCEFIAGQKQDCNYDGGEVTDNTTLNGYITKLNDGPSVSETIPSLTEMDQIFSDYLAACIHKYSLVTITSSNPNGVRFADYTGGGPPGASYVNPAQYSSCQTFKRNNTTRILQLRDMSRSFYVRHDDCGFINGANDFVSYTPGDNQGHFVIDITNNNAELGVGVHQFEVKCKKIFNNLPEGRVIE